MGGQQDKAQLQVVVDMPSIISGEQISGTVNLKIIKELKGAVVLLKLTGKEKNSFQRENYIHTGNVKIIEYESILYTTNGKIMQIGDYSIPFVVQAPSGLPDTFISMSREYSAKIDYFVKAEIQEGNKKIIGKH